MALYNKCSRFQTAFTYEPAICCLFDFTFNFLKDINFCSRIFEKDRGAARLQHPDFSFVLNRCFYRSLVRSVFGFVGFLAGFIKESDMSNAFLVEQEQNAASDQQQEGDAADDDPCDRAAGKSAVCSFRILKQYRIGREMRSFLSRNTNPSPPCRIAARERNFVVSAPFSPFYRSACGIFKLLTIF